MWLRFFLSVPLLFCFGLVFPDAEAQYRITETQLQSIETSLEKLELDRQSWESQARGLNQRLGASEKLAGTLNDQLRQEREQYRKLETSYNRSEARWSAITGRLTEEKQEAVTGLAEEKRKTLKAEHQRNWLALILVLVLIPAFYLGKKYFTR